MKGYRTVGVAFHELADPRVIGIHQFVGRTLPQHLAIAHHIDVVGDARGFRQIMGNHDAGDTQRVVEQADQAHQHAHGDGVLAYERLVVHEDLRVQGDGPGQGHTTLHAAGQLVGHQVDGTAQPDRLQLEQDDIADHFIRQLGMNAQRKGDVLEHIEIGKQRAALKQHAHLLAGVEQIATRQFGQVLAVDPDFTAAGAQLRAHQPQERGLAATGRPHDAGDLAPWNTDIDIIEDAARTALEGQSLQLDRVGVIGTHLNSLRCSLTLGRLAPCREYMHPGQAELAANYITADTEPPRPKPSVFRFTTG